MVYWVCILEDMPLEGDIHLYMSYFPSLHCPNTMVATKIHDTKPFFESGGNSFYWWAKVKV